jgi:hypothetical protein
MQLINYTTPRLLIADEGKHFRDKNDVYVPEHMDEETGELIPAHYPYYMTMCFPGVQIQTLEDALEIYVEEEIKED